VKKNYLEYLIPATLALVITVGLIRFIPVLTGKYTMELISSEVVPPEDFTYYFDLDGDGTSEVLTIYYNSSGNLSVSIATNQLATINQFNLPGRLTRLGPTLDMHDIDSNGIVDLFLCTEKNDSLFLSIIDNLHGHPTTLSTHFLDLINQLNDNGDYLFSPGGISDLNGDGTPEYIMAINGGHSLQPRKVYAIDYKNDSVMRSPLSGAAIVSLDLFDLDSDGTDEIILNTVAPENFKSFVPFRDSISWLMILDENLEFYTAPEAMHGPPSWVSVEPFIHEGANYLMVYHKYRENEEYQAFLSIYNDSVQMIKSTTFHGYMHSGHHLYRVPGRLDISDIKFLSKEGIGAYNFDLQLTDSIVNETSFGYGKEALLDVDADGMDEFVFHAGGKLFIYRSDFRESANFELPVEARNPRTLISLKKDGEAYPVLHVQMDEKRYTLEYRKNKWFLYRKVVYPGLFLSLFGLFYLWIIFQNRLVSKRYEKDKQISQLQLQSIKSQLDPHFTYNALNAVGSLIYKGEKDLAYQYLKGLTDLLRMVSGDSSRVTWTLSDELEFVLKYMDIEKLRFREKFNFKINVEVQKLKQYQIPKMSILTFVENAIKHGLRHREYDRMLEVSASEWGSGIKIEIRDNGIGRAAASRYQEDSAGKGIKMMKKYFKQFNEVTGKKARFEVKDLFEYDLKAAGTLVVISIK